ncbi:hypothetical protein TRFO_24886 [Tritrichomonas foetus]|uniref:Tubby C-terminal domain-containing protein n=1 Tax=Tritrichomonas foetus TaxID=1144522 RepID=A0A1J4KBT9_9EUKA|nr:hypothetical protein TRFO_24886 [Tritrichomonas foetus]|eukprot:OHT06933.1 hypothetical protein TRFO_24886 [Tritrichomonas foetus]
MSNRAGYRRPGPRGGSSASRGGSTPRGGSVQRGSRSVRGGQTATPNRSRQNLSLDLSSYSESDSSELPIITTAATGSGSINLITDSSYESSDSSSVDEVKPEADWSSKNPRPAPKPSPPKPDTNSQANSPASPSPHRVRRPIRKIPAQSSPTPNSQNQTFQNDSSPQEEEHRPQRGSRPPNIQPDNETPPPSPPRSPIQNQNSQPIQSQQPQAQPQQNATNPVKNEPPPPQDDEETFQIVYEQRKLLPQWKRYVQMTQRDILVYRCESVKIKQYGKVHVIVTKPPVDFNSQHYVGMLVRHQSGTRFTLHAKAEQHAAPSPQLMGLSFFDMDDDDANIRTFRVAIPDHVYTPTGKEDDLSRIAFRGKDVPGVKIWCSVMPTKHEDGTLTLDLGPYSIVRSTKNFVIRDENRKAVFTIFKTYDGICTVKVRPPFTPLFGFAIAAAISTSSK